MAEIRRSFEQRETLARQEFENVTNRMRLNLDEVLEI